MTRHTAGPHPRHQPGRSRRYRRIAACIAVALRGPAGAGELIAITELLRNPSGSESHIPGGRSHEFVEFANIGSTVLSLEGLYLQDGADEDSLTLFSALAGHHPNCRTSAEALQPGDIAVVLDRDYDSAMSVDAGSAFAFADSTVLLTVADAQLVSGLTTTRGVMLCRRVAGGTRKVLAAAADGPLPMPPDTGKVYLTSAASETDGRSLVLTSLLFGGARYGLCPTSVSPGAVELLEDGWIVESRLGARNGMTVQCSLAAYHAGALLAAAASYDVISTAGHSLERSPPVVDSMGVARFGVSVPLDTVGYSFTLTHGATTLSRPIDITPIWAPPGAVLINEISPRAGPDGPEWFEIVNTAPIPVNLAGWRFGNPEDTATVGPDDVMLAPQGYMVLAKDAVSMLERYPTLRDVIEPAGWHTLSNYGDTLLLWDGGGQIHERVIYSHRWFDSWERGSLERLSLSSPALDGSAWAVADRATPGLPNGSLSWRAERAPSMEIGPRPFTPNGDGRSDLLAIDVKLAGNAAVTVTVYSMEGRDIREFTGPAKSRYFWDGRTTNGTPAPAGPFFVVVDIVAHDNTRVRIRKRGILWR